MSCPTTLFADLALARLGLAKMKALARLVDLQCHPVAHGWEVQPVAGLGAQPADDLRFQITVDGPHHVALPVLGDHATDPEAIQGMSAPELLQRIGVSQVFERHGVSETASCAMW